MIWSPLIGTRHDAEHPWLPALFTMIVRARGDVVAGDAATALTFATDPHTVGASPGGTDIRSSTTLVVRGGKA
jgi:hypothetical protein